MSDLKREYARAALERLDKAIERFYSDIQYGLISLEGKPLELVQETLNEFQKLRAEVNDTSHDAGKARYEEISRIANGGTEDLGELRQKLFMIKINDGVAKKRGLFNLLKDLRERHAEVGERIKAGSISLSEEDLKVYNDLGKLLQINLRHDIKVGDVENIQREMGKVYERLNKIEQRGMHNILAREMALMTLNERVNAYRNNAKFSSDLEYKYLVNQMKKEITEAIRELSMAIKKGKEYDVGTLNDLYKKHNEGIEKYMQSKSKKPTIRDITQAIPGAIRKAYQKKKQSTETKLKSESPPKKRQSIQKTPAMARKKGDQSKSLISKKEALSWLDGQIQTRIKAIAMRPKEKDMPERINLASQEAREYIENCGSNKVDRSEIQSILNKIDNPPPRLSHQ